MIVNKIVGYILVFAALIPVQAAGFLTNDLQGLFSFCFIPLFILAAYIARFFNIKNNTLKYLTVLLATISAVGCIVILGNYITLRETVGFFGTLAATPVSINIAGIIGLAMFAAGQFILLSEYRQQYKNSVYTINNHWWRQTIYTAYSSQNHKYNHYQSYL